MMRSKKTQMAFVLIIAAVILPFFAASVQAMPQEYAPNLEVYYESREKREVLRLMTEDGLRYGEDTMELVASITEGLTDDYEKAKAIHIWVAENLWYDYDWYYDDTLELFYAPSEILVEKRTVCSGYANLAGSLLRAAGIPAVVVDGFSEGEGHAWNEAYVNGRWILMDPTWDSYNFYEEGEFSRQYPAGDDYFDISMAALSRDHTIGGYEPYLYGDDLVQEMRIPKDTRVIGDYAFWECTGLKRIGLPRGIISIGTGAFLDCTSLERVDIPEGVRYIAPYAFWGCTGLKDVRLPQNSTEIPEGMFCESGLETFLVPQGIKVIGYYAFSDCAQLQSVTLPDSVELIRAGAFSNCVSLASIVIPPRIVILKADVFEGCTGLTSILIPEGVRRIEKDAFIDCPDLTIYGKEGSYAETYAVENGIPFVAERAESFDETGRWIRFDLAG